uniref:Retrotransposon gag domain-containing protein n=1 Tax=Cajanus cajan TaxID=3821 RepID=A0A151R9D6_CAJCA|nr:hypothetical protein KK1_039592 [Cajanus cajan]
MECLTKKPNHDDDGHSSTTKPSLTDNDGKDEDATTHSWLKKVVLPTFEGSDPLGWLARAEKFFEVHQVKSSERLRVAFISMEGKACQWFQYWRNQAKHPSWEDFT